MFSERNTRTYGVFCLFKSARTHTLDTGWYEHGSSLKARGRPGFTKQGDESRQDSKENFGKVVLESWYYTRRVVQRYSREFPTGCCWAPIPQKAAEKVLEAWNYTRRWCRSGPGGLVLHQGGWDRSDPRGGNWIPGNSRLRSSVQIPPEYGDD